MKSIQLIKDKKLIKLYKFLGIAVVCLILTAIFPLFGLLAIIALTIFSDRNSVNVHID